MNLSSVFMRYPVYLASIAFMTLGTPAAAAQTFVSGGGVSVNVQDLDADLQRVPPELRAKTFADPVAVHTNISNIYVRRVLAAEAASTGMDKDPAVKAALEMARDRILSDLRLAQIDQAKQPSLKALQAYAMTVYKANPNKFDMPEQIKIRHILLRSGEQDARAKVEQMLKDLQAGASFEELAKTRSQDPGSAVKGGDLGWVARGRMVKPFEEAAFKLSQPGTLSGIVETQFGFHIIKLDESRPAGPRSFEEVKDILLKEAQSTLINNTRLAEKDRILSAAQFDNAAIEAFSKAQSK